MIGKKDPDNPEMMFPNSKFESFYGPIDPEVELLRAIFNKDYRIKAGRFNIIMAYGAFPVMWNV